MEQKKKNIVLIGFMGCGKTSVGIKLSYRLKYPFCDTDRQIEKMQGKSISEIFASEGEAPFRQMETDCINKLINDSGCSTYIFSTGGGTPVKEENRELLKQLGTVIYLKVSSDVVYNRLKGDTSRPLLQTDNPKARIDELLEMRKDAYESAADIVIDTDGKNLEDIVEEIAALVEK